MPNTITAMSLLVVFTLFTWLLVSKRNIAALSLLVIFSFISVMNVHPLYRGVDMLTSNPLSTFIQQTKKPNTTWIVSDAIQLENFASMGGAHSLSGVYLLPQTELFNQLPASNGDATTNRYAHVIYNVSDKNAQENIQLLQADVFKVNIDPCGNFIKKNNITHIIATEVITSSCTTVVYTFATHKVNPSFIYVYEIIK